MDKVGLETSQDFNHRFAIVVRKDLIPWQIMNVTAHVAAYLGNKIDIPFDTGESFSTEDMADHPRNSQFPILILEAPETALKSFVALLRESGLLYLGFIREMIETTNDEEIANILKSKKDVEIEYLAAGVFGPNETVKNLTRKFSLWK